MKNIIPFAVYLLLVACSSDPDTREMPDGKTWMVKNLDIEVPGSACYDDLPANCEKYGRLYTWEVATKVCSLQGEGWRLPSNDDWKELAKHYGGVRTEAADGGKAAFAALIEGGSSQFNAVFGGGKAPDGTFRRGDAHGFYWTSTETSDSTAWLYNFGKNGKLLNHHHDNEKADAVSVRCVKDN